MTLYNAKVYIISSVDIGRYHDLTRTTIYRFSRMVAKYYYFHYLKNTQFKFSLMTKQFDVVFQSLTFLVSSLLSVLEIVVYHC